ncbi:MAG TPA: TetR/AcrR family transcriptional regulator C-terminal domain-containing protein [Gaiellaceae bacterium]|nr:TetR/AcrR family transcriptional regulator C-terminal domain-containing protein [Gaiellaceae bacterium]
MASEKGTTRRARRAPLSRERVLRAAIELADEGGLEALTMRRLGHALGVEAMSLYNHVANKDEILDGIVDLVLGEVELPPGGDWREAVRRCALSAYDALLRHPWACSVAMGSPRILPARFRYIEWVLRRFREAGFSPELTFHAYHALDSHILGFTLWEVGHAIDTDDLPGLVERFFSELPAGAYPYLAEHAEQHIAGIGREGEGEFAFVLDLLLDSLERARDAS